MAQMPGTPPSESGAGAYPTLAPQVAYVIKPRPRWHALRTISGILKVLAWMTGGAGVLGVLFALTEVSQFGSFGIIGGLLLAGATVLGAGMAFLSLYGYAELILVLVSIEENTRKL